jgi:hypothetical protein
MKEERNSKGERKRKEREKKKKKKKKEFEILTKRHWARAGGHENPPQIKNNLESFGGNDTSLSRFSLK